MLIQAATAVERVRDADRFHVDATYGGVDQAAVVDEMDDVLGGIAADKRERYQAHEHLTLFEERTAFVDERTVSLGDEEVTADKVVVAAGSRPVVPPIDGLDDVDYLTSRDALYLRETPERLVILGGGYIAVELGYYFEAMGSDVAILEKSDTLVSREDGDVASAFTDIAADRHDVFTGYLVTAVEETGNGYAVHAESEDGDTLTVEGNDVLVALGRRPNSDTLDPEAAGIAIDDRASSRPTSTWKPPRRTSGRRATLPGTRCSNTPVTTKRVTRSQTSCAGSGLQSTSPGCPTPSSPNRKSPASVPPRRNSKRRTSHTSSVEPNTQTRPWDGRRNSRRDS